MMQALKADRDTSVAFSLRELQELEQRRVSDEQTKRVEAELATVRARDEAEQRRLAAEDAALRADREERYRIEATRAEAARQERLTLAAHEVRERERHQAELAAVRLHEEMAIRRIEANKKRPKWMLAVTVLATLATGVLVWFTIQAVDQSAKSAQATKLAQAESAAAIQARKDSDADLARLEAQLGSLDARVTTAVEQVIKAEGAVQIAKAKKDMLAAKEARDQAAIAIAKAKAKRESDIRKQGVRISEGCINNSLSKECTK